MPLSNEAQLRMKAVVALMLSKTRDFPKVSAVIFADVLVDCFTKLAEGKKPKDNVMTLSDDTLSEKMYNAFVAEIPDWRSMKKTWPGNDYTAVKAEFDKANKEEEQLLDENIIFMAKMAPLTKAGMLVFVEREIVDCLIHEKSYPEEEAILLAGIVAPLIIPLRQEALSVEDSLDNLAGLFADVCPYWRKAEPMWNGGRRIAFLKSCVEKLRNKTQLN